MKKLLIFIFAVLFTTATAFAQSNQWFSHPAPNNLVGKYTHLVSWQMYVNPATGDTFIRLASASRSYTTCVLSSRAGAYYAMSFNPPNSVVSNWYPIGKYGVQWDYACD